MVVCRPGGNRLREIVIGAAQMGPIQKADSRAAVVERMITPKPITH